MTYNEMEDLYDGYLFAVNSASVYNPISLLYYLRDTHLPKTESYWIDTQAHPNTAMEALIAARLRNTSIILDLRAHDTANSLFQPPENAHIPKQDEKNCAVNLNRPSFESVFFFQNGYLTIYKHDPVHDLYTLKFSNGEIMQTFMQGIEFAIEEDDERIALHREAKSILQNLNIDMFVKTFNIFLEFYSSLMETNTPKHEGLVKVFFTASLKTYTHSRRAVRIHNMNNGVYSHPIRPYT